MKKIVFIFFLLIINKVFCQSSEDAKKLLDDVSETMKSYTNMVLEFSTSLINEEAGINENDKTPNPGSIKLKGEK